MAGTVQGERGGFIVTRGKPRYAQLEGRHFAVGRGNAYECPTIAEAYAKRDELLRAEQAANVGRRVAVASLVPCALEVGATVRIDRGEGVILEVGDRSVLVKTYDGNLWRRVPADCKALP